MKLAETVQSPWSRGNARQLALPVRRVGPAAQRGFKLRNIIHLAGLQVAVGAGRWVDAATSENAASTWADFVELSKASLGSKATKATVTPPEPPAPALAPPPPAVEPPPPPPPPVPEPPTLSTITDTVPVVPNVTPSPPPVDLPSKLTEIKPSLPDLKPSLPDLKSSLPEFKPSLPSVDLPSVKLELPTVDVSSQLQALQDAQGKGAAALQDITSQGSSAINGVLGKASESLSGITSTLSKELDVAKGTLTGATSAVQSAVDSLTGAVSSTTGTVTSVIDANTQQLQTAISSTTGAVSSSTLNSLQQAYDSLPPPAQTAASYLGKGVAALSSLAVAHPISASAVAAGVVIPLVIRSYSAKYTGYSGELDPPQVRALLLEDSRSALVDIRPEFERESDGLPELKLAARFKAAAFTPDLVLASGQASRFANVRQLEQDINAAYISGLPIIPSPLTRVIIMDGSGSDSARSIARALRRVGIPDVYIMRGGFKAWASADLGVVTGKTDYVASTIDYLGDEIEVISERTAEALSPLADPWVGVPAVSAAVFAGVALYNYHITLQYIGVYGVLFTLANQLSKYDSPDALLADLKALSSKASKLAGGARPARPAAATRAVAAAPSAAPAAAASAVGAEAFAEEVISELQAAAAAEAVAAAQQAAEEQEEEVEIVERADGQGAATGRESETGGTSDAGFAYSVEAGLDTAKPLSQ